jgi:hypothetical protein
LTAERGTDDRGSGGAGSPAVCVLLDPPPQLARAIHSENNPTHGAKNLPIHRLLPKASNFDALAMT